MKVSPLPAATIQPPSLPLCIQPTLPSGTTPILTLSLFRREQGEVSVLPAVSLVYKNVIWWGQPLIVWHLHLSWSGASRVPCSCLFPPTDLLVLMISSVLCFLLCFFVSSSGNLFVCFLVFGV